MIVGFPEKVDLDIFLKTYSMLSRTLSVFVCLFDGFLLHNTDSSLIRKQNILHLVIGITKNVMHVKFVCSINISKVFPKYSGNSIDHTVFLSVVLKISCVNYFIGIFVKI